MILIIGLGNPGEKYKNTRHNIGFRIIDKFAKRNNLPEFKISKKFRSLISEGIIYAEKIMIVKPQTFMNESGKAVKKIMSNVACQMSNVVIIHDDIDIALGKIRISQNRNSAGHKGIESIIKETGTKHFTRFRVGIKSAHNEPARTTEDVQLDGQRTMDNKEKEADNEQKITKKVSVEKFVLQKFSKEEEKNIEEVIERTVNAIEIYLEQGIDEAMNKYNYARRHK